MKPILIVFIAILTIYSCKKDYTCTCSTMAVPIGGVRDTIIKNTKSNADATCKTYTTNYWNECHIK